jgi:hypothetical protein
VKRPKGRAPGHEERGLYSGSINTIAAKLAAKEPKDHKEPVSAFVFFAFFRGYGFI